MANSANFSAALVLVLLSVHGAAAAKGDPQVCAAVLIFCASVAAVLVSPDGHDASSCGPSSTPCRTISFALRNITRSGDVVIVRSGVYRDETIMYWRNEFFPEPYKLPDHVSLIADNTSRLHTPPFVRGGYFGIQGRNLTVAGLSFHSVMLQVFGSDLTITSITVTNCTVPTNKWGDPNDGACFIVNLFSLFF